MSTMIDGAEVLRIIGDNPAAFPDAKAEIQKAALAVVIAQLKARSLDCTGLSTVGQVLGLRTLELVLENVPDKTVASLTKKLDPHHPEAKNADAIRQRKHLCSLAAGQNQPYEKPPRKSAPRKSTTAKKTARAKELGVGQITKENFWPSSMTAVGGRKRR